MTKTSKQLLYILAAILLARLFSMYILPLTDTTEARYAEMARIMAETNDWITPYVNYNVPFWGKPPLSFWLQAISIDMFGVNEFAARFPSWLMHLAVVGLIFKLLLTVANKYTAIWGMLIYTSIALVYTLSGTVLTDPFLTLGSTLSFVSFIIVLKEKERYWGYLFFVGLSIGLLSKGPLILVLTGGTIGLWLLFSTKRWRVFKLYPWVSGIILMLVLTLPWYIMAELKTPGFLNYYIIGEHFYRFIDPGWTGDKYGIAHKRDHGTIWIYWIAASLPWGLIALSTLLKKMFMPKPFKKLGEELTKEDISFYVIWAIFPMLFFTFAGNILWTYVLPALPALAILLALYINREEKPLTQKYRALLISTVLFVPLIATIGVTYVSKDDNALPTEKFLIKEYFNVSNGKNPIYYISNKSLSMRFYSKGKAEEIKVDKLKDLFINNNGSFYLACSDNVLSTTDMFNNTKEELYKNKRFTLVKITSKNNLDNKGE